LNAAAARVSASLVSSPSLPAADFLELAQLIREESAGRGVVLGLEVAVIVLAFHGSCVLELQSDDQVQRFII
jgi:hypothetical protein